MTRALSHVSAATFKIKNALAFCIQKKPRKSCTPLFRLHTFRQKKNVLRSHTRARARKPAASACKSPRARAHKRSFLGACASKLATTPPPLTQCKNYSAWRGRIGDVEEECDQKLTFSMAGATKLDAEGCKQNKRFLAFFFSTRECKRTFLFIWHIATLWYAQNREDVKILSDRI